MTKKYSAKCGGCNGHGITSWEDCGAGYSSGTETCSSCGGSGRISLEIPAKFYKKFFMCKTKSELVETLECRRETVEEYTKDILDIEKFLTKDGQKTILKK